MPDKPAVAERLAKGPMPPHVQLFDILTKTELDDLLRWAISKESSFKPAKVYRNPGEERNFNPDSRTALKLHDFGNLEPMLEERMLDRLPEIMKAINYVDLPPTKLELELNAYGDGGHFKAHTDVLSGTRQKPLNREAREHRMLTAVYYFHSEPKGFSGGDLRLFRFGSKGENVLQEDVVTYEPIQNSLLAFPAWTRHEVDRVSCPSGRFADNRFALNCWFCRTIGG